LSLPVALNAGEATPLPALIVTGTSIDASCSIIRPMSHLRQSRKCDRVYRTLLHARVAVARHVFRIERCSILCDFDARQRRATKSQVWHRSYNKKLGIERVQACTR